MNLQSGSTGRSARLHAVDPDARVTDLGASALCGQWLVDLADERVVWNANGPNACLVCREKQRQVLAARGW